MSCPPTNTPRPDVPTVVLSGREILVRRSAPHRFGTAETGQRYVGVVDPIDAEVSLAWLRGALADAYHTGRVDALLAESDRLARLVLAAGPELDRMMP